MIFWGKERFLPVVEMTERGVRNDRRKIVKAKTEDKI